MTFKLQIMRLIPSLMKQYGLHELTTRHQLLRNVHALFRKHADVKDSRCLDKHSIYSTYVE